MNVVNNEDDHDAIRENSYEESKRSAQSQFLEPKRSPGPEFLPQAFLNSLSVEMNLPGPEIFTTSQKTEQDINSWEENDEIAFNRILEPLPNIEQRLDQFKSQRALDHMSFGQSNSFLFDSHQSHQYPQEENDDSESHDPVSPIFTNTLVMN